MTSLLRITSLLCVSVLLGVAFSPAPTQAQDAPFITIWDTENLGDTDDNQIAIGSGTDYTIEWEEVGNTSNNGSVTVTVEDTILTFPNSGIYRLSIVGGFTNISYTAGDSIDAPRNPEKIIQVTQWGDVQWSSMQSAFGSCSNLELSTSDKPDLSNVTDMSGMFNEATSLTGTNSNIGNWDTGSVTNMSSMFSEASSFNADISEWDTGNVTDMSDMFGTNIGGATSFNQDINSWDVSNVIDMSGMFNNAHSFNQDLNNWDVSNVEYMGEMFYDAESFKGDISKWDVSGVLDMNRMFRSAEEFNSDISSWDVSSVEDMRSMFNDANNFNIDIGQWNTSSVTDMLAMFNSADIFNQSIGSWDISNVDDMSRLFTGTAVSVNNYDRILIGWAQQDLQAGVTLGAADFRNSLPYCNSGPFRTHIIEAFNWTVDDDGRQNSCPEILSASAATQVDEDGTFSFPGVPADISFSGLLGSGRLTVARYSDAPRNVGGISESNVGEYRLVIAGGGITFFSSTELRLPANEYDGVGPAETITVYSRSQPGTGSFTELTTSFDEQNNEIVVTTGNANEFEFGELAFAANTIVVNDDEGGASPPCNSTPDASTISGGLSQMGDGVLVCAGFYSPATLNVQKSTTLRAGAGVTISDQLTLNSGRVDVSSGSLTLTSASETGAAAISGSGSGSISGDVTFERFLAKSDDASHFRMLSAPTATLLDDEGSGSNAGNLLSDMWTQSDGSSGTGADAEGAGASVFTFNEDDELNGAPLSTAWAGATNLNSGPGDFTPGTGFLAFLFADRNPDDGTTEGFPATLTATGPVKAEENSGSPIDLSSQITFTDDSDLDEDNGWNLIANPFMAPIDWESIENDGADLSGIDATIYVWDAANGAYATYQADGSGTGGSAGGTGTQDRYIAPFQAFFVKANGNASDPDIGGIDSGDKAIGEAPEVKGSENSSPRITIRLQPEGDSSAGETTAFRFADDAETGKDPYDAYQLTPLTSPYALVASEMGETGTLFDHQSRPVPTEQDTIGLAFDLTQSGTYSLEAGTLATVPNDWSVILENTESGARYDLGAGETVTFDYTAPESAPKTASSSPAAAMLKEGGPTVAKADSSDGGPSYRLYVGPAAALPVELASFEVNHQGTSANLSWQTASETSNAGFAIERRTEAGTWTQIGFRDGAGSTNESQTYRYTDEDVPFETERVTYRLRQKDLDGTTTLSDKVTVELGAPSKTQLHAPFPNPVREQATLRYELATAADVQIAVYDVLGRRVHTVTSGRADAGRHQKRIRAGDMPAGTYFVRMQTNADSQTRRLTVVR